MKVKELIEYFEDQPQDEEVTVYCGDGEVLGICDIHDTQIQLVYYETEINLDKDD
jgi:hypothetical protein